MAGVYISIVTALTCLTTRVMPLQYECTPSSRQSSVGIANCSSQLLAFVPANLPHNIRELDLSNNHITKLSDYAFVKYEYLEILFLRNNTMSRLEPQAFSRMTTVLYLDLSFNHLLSIPSQSFHGLTALLTLSLRGNRITSIRQNTFERVSKLTQLYLSGNHIQYIHPNAFARLSLLQHLELQNNALTTLNGTVFRHFSRQFKEIKLYNNPWYCDCNLRWLVQWLKNTSASRTQSIKWKFNMDEPVCQGPSIIEQRPFSSVTSDLFICPIRMYSKARNIETPKGSAVNLFCKYMSDPYVEMRWQKNGRLIDISETDKYEMESEGDTMVTSKLHIKDFQYEDIGEYECYAKNKLGKAFDTCLITLEGVDPSDILMPQESIEKEDKDRVRNAIIASSTIGGIVFLFVIIGVVIFGLVRCKRYRRRKKESIRMTFEEHLKANGIIEPNPKAEPMVYDEVVDGTLSMDAEMEENELMYDSLQRQRIPSDTNTNTYISFKTEFSEPDDMTQIYPQNVRPINNSKGSDGSQCESTSPLLENISPILIDPHDPFYEANLYVPRLESLAANYYNSTTQQDYCDDNGFLPYRAQTLPHNGHVPHDDSYIPHRTRTLPHGYSSNHMRDFDSLPVIRGHGYSANHKSASVGHLGMSPPKKPPRMFHSRDTMSLYSQSSDRDNGLRFSLPRPGTVDQYGTAV